MAQPISLSRYIMICTKSPLEEDQYKSWYKTVKQHSPSGVVTTVTSSDNKGKPQVVYMVHRKTKNRNCYMIPLTRDLNEEEVQRIVDIFGASYPDLNFDIETNECKIVTKDNESIDLNSEEHHRLCMAFEKKRHEDWVRERVNSGWRYGTSFSANEKTHPLILPWDKLPDQFRKPDLDWPQKMVDLLRDQGYVILKKGDLEAIMQFVRGAL